MLTSSRSAGREATGPRPWMTRALCATRPDVDFFPDDPVDETPAINVCSGCPVRRPCLDHAVGHRELGIWGGTTEAQRRRIRLRRMAA